MVKIYKYRIDEYGITELKDRFIGVLKVGWQGNDLCVWCLVSEFVKESLMTFYSLPTGYEFSFRENMHYLDSVTHGPYVWHIFYETFSDKCKKGEH